MPIIHINVKEKIAKGNKDEFIVCNNSDYEILFDFDKEWEEYNHKTAIVTLSNREFVPILFDGNKCKLPPLQNATFCKIGVMASLENDDATIRISTTTPASINCLESAYDENGEILPPTDDIYQQILAKLNDINTNISRGGTTVTVGGVEQKTWNADTKVDKVTTTGQDKVYMCDSNGNQTTKVISSPYYIFSYSTIPVYCNATDTPNNVTDNPMLLISPATPTKPYHTANKKYVDDGLSEKLSLPTPADLSNGGTNRLAGIQPNGTTQIWFRINPLYIYPTTHNTQNTVIPAYKQAGTAFVNKETGATEALDNIKNTIFVATPILDYEASNKLYVDTGLDGKLDKVTTEYRIYGTDGNGNQKVYTTGWSPTSGYIQMLDYTPNGGYTEDGSFNKKVTGTYVIGIPNKPAHATPKKWVEDTVKHYNHRVFIRTSGDVTYSIHALNHTATAVETFSDVGTIEGISKIQINDSGSYGVIVDIINFNFYKPNEDTLGILTIEGLVCGEIANGRQTFEITESDISEIGDYVV